MSASLTVERAQLERLPAALRAIAGATGASAREVVTGFAGVILKTCAGNTKVAPAEKTVIRSQKRLIRDLGLSGGKNSGAFDIVTINAGVKADFGRAFLRTTSGFWRRTHDANFKPVAGWPSKGRTKPGDHYSDYEWLVLRSAIQTVRARLQAARAAGKRAAGLARQSWVQIADTLGIRLEDVRGGGRLSAAGIAKARAAMASNGQRYQNGLSREEQKQGAFLITLINRYPEKAKRGRPLGLDATLRRAMLGQVSYFERNLELGVFNSIEKTARAYPFIAVRRAA